MEIKHTFRILRERSWPRLSPSYRMAAGNFILLLIERVARALLSLLVGAWVLRYLGPEASGSLNFIVASVAIFAATSRLGLDSIVLRDINLAPESSSTILGTALSLRATAGIVLFCLLAFFASAFVHARDTSFMVLILASGLLAQPLELFELWFQAQGTLKKPVISRLAVLLFLAAARVIAVVSGAGLLVFSVFVAAEGWLTGIANYLFFRAGSADALIASRARAFAFLRESWTYLFSGLAIIVYMRLDQVMLGTLLNARSVGIFTAATSFSEPLNFIPIAINTAILPWLTRLKVDDIDAYERAVASYCNITLAYSTLLVVIIWTVAPELVSLLFGAKYVESAGVLRIFGLSYVFVSSGVAQATWYINERRGDVLLKKTLVGATVNVVANVMLIPHFGPVGAAWGSVLATFTATFGSNMIFDRRLVKIQFGFSTSATRNS